MAITGTDLFSKGPKLPMERKYCVTPEFADWVRDYIDSLNVSDVEVKFENWGTTTNHIGIYGEFMTLWMSVEEHEDKSMWIDVDCWSMGLEPAFTDFMSGLCAKAREMGVRNVILLRKIADPDGPAWLERHGFTLISNSQNFHKGRWVINPINFK